MMSSNDWGLLALAFLVSIPFTFAVGALNHAMIPAGIVALIEAAALILCLAQYFKSQEREKEVWRIYRRR